MKLEQKNIESIIIGFRFEKAFRIADISGGIIDTVLHDQSTPFGTEYFPQYQDISIYDRALMNDKTGTFIRITSSDIIFKYSFILGENNQDKEISWVRDHAIPFIIDKVLKQNRIKNYIRVGMMMNHNYVDENLGGKFIEKLSNGATYSADQFSLSFGMKDTTVEALIRKNVNDYVNKIFLLRQTDTSNYEITFDYQYLFNPIISQIDDWSFPRFMDSALRGLNKIFYPFINTIIEKTIEVK